jgi:hypothetical protein
VEEDQLSEEGGLESIPHTEDATTPPRNLPRGTPSPGAISGTTAISSLAASEARVLDPDTMIPNLLALYNTAGELLRVSVPAHASAARLGDLLQEIKKPGAASARRLHQSENAFAGYKEDFGDLSGYIDPQGVMKAVFEQSLPPRDSQSWRVIEILQAANLAWLARWIISAERDNSRTWDQLRKLDNNFPLDFLSSIYQSSQNMESASWMSGCSSLQEETFNLALEIRTQVAVLALTLQHQRDDFDSEHVLRNVFYSLDPSENETLNAWDVNGLGSGNLGLLPEFDQAMQQRISVIRRSFLEDSRALSSGASTELQILEAQFSWSNFSVKTLEWIRRRNAELTTSIEKHGGVDSIVASLKQELSMENSMVVTSATPRHKIATSAPRGSAQASAKKTKSRKR